MLLTKWLHEPIWISKVNVIHWFWWLGPRSFRFNIFKLLFLRNRLVDWSQILCGASMGLRNESEYKWFTSHDQDGCHAHTWWKPLKIFFLWTKRLTTLKLGMQYWQLEYCQDCLKMTWFDLDLFYSKVKIGPFCFCMGKFLRCRFPRNCGSLWGES